MDPHKMGEFIMLLRKERKLTQSQLGNLIFVARETIGKWERGVNIPDAHSLVLLSHLFNVSINEIIAGEYINASNEEQINTLALSILESNKQNIRIKRNILIISIIIAIVLFFITYFLTNFNSLRIYLITGENDFYSLSRSLIVLSKEKSYIQIGNIIDKETNTNISTLKNYKISVYYEESGKDTLLFSSLGSDTLYTTLDDKEIIKEKKFITILDNLYLSIENENEISKIKLNVRLDYINNHLFSMNVRRKKEEDEPSSLDDSVIINENTEEDWQVLAPVEYETPSKKLSLNATCSSNKNTCRVTFTTVWKNKPIKKAYDLIGVRLDNTFFLDEHQLTLANDYLEPDYAHQSNAGLVSIFDMNREEITTITQSFNVAYQGTIYASYQHAIKDNTLNKTQEFEFSSSGLGEVFGFNSEKLEKYYDNSPGIKLVLKEE